MTVSASDVSSLLPTLVAQALVSSREVGPMVNIVPRYTMNQGTLTLPEVGSLSVSALTEGVAINTSKKATVSGATLTAGKWGGGALITDEAFERAKAGNFDLLNEYGVGFGIAYGQEIDKALVDLFSGLDTHIGTAGTELTLAELLKAPFKLRAAKIPGPFFGVLHPNQAYNLMKDIVAPDSTKGFPYAESLAAMGVDLNKAEPYFLRNFGGVPFYQDPFITVDGSDDAYGACFNPMALAFGVEKDMLIETEREIGVGWNVVVTGRWAVVERKGTYGTGMLYDAATLA